MKPLERREIIAIIFIVVLIIASIAAIVFAFGLFMPAKPAYEFKTGVNHPQEISNLIKNGTVVLYFSENDCPPCDNMTSKIAYLQSQYKGTDVTFRTFNFEDNATSLKIFRSYGIQWVPQVFVIRADGAVANFTYKNNDMDFSAIRSAIEDAQKLEQPYPTQVTPTSTPSGHNHILEFTKMLIPTYA